VIDDASLASFIISARTSHLYTDDIFDCYGNFCAYGNYYYY